MLHIKFLDNELNPTARKCDPLTGALIQGGSGVLGSLVGGIFGSASQNSANKTNMHIAQMNNEFNERMMQKQMNYNTDMWNKQNEYNAPSAQVARLKAAGLNPYLMMSGSNGNLGSASSANSANMASSSGNPNMQAYNPQSAIDSGVNAVGGAIANYISAKKAEGELAKMQFENQLLAEQVRSVAKDNEYKSLMNDEILRGYKFDNYTKAADYESKLWSNRYQQETYNSDVNIKRLQEQNLYNSNVLQGLTSLQMSLQNKQLQNDINAFPQRLRAELNEAYARSFAAFASGKASLSQSALNFKLAVTETLKQRGIHYDNTVKLRSINSLVKTAQYTASQAKWNAERAKHNSGPDSYFQMMNGANGFSGSGVGLFNTMDYMLKAIPFSFLK